MKYAGINTSQRKSVVVTEINKNLDSLKLSGSFRMRIPQMAQRMIIKKLKVINMIKASAGT